MPVKLVGSTALMPVKLGGGGGGGSTPLTPVTLGGWWGRPY